jgi:hypothetical protein
LSPLAFAVVVGVAVFWGHAGHHVRGGWLVVLDGLVAGLPGGALMGFLWKRAAPPPTDPTDSSPFLA